MAMSGNAVKNVGSYGKIRVLINVTSQSTANNTSTVRVRGQMALRQGSRAFNNNGVSMRIYGTNGITSRSSTTPFDVGTSWKTVRDETYTVSHASNGTRTISASFALGSTGTSSFGSGGTVTKSLTIDRIPRAPSTPGKPSVSNATSNSFRASVSAPASNGASITQYQWQAGSNTFTSTGRTITITGRTANASHRVRVRARNSVGWSSWSAWSNYISTKPNSPAAPTNVTATRVSDTNQHITWTRRATSAAPYTSQRVQRNYWTGTARSAWVTIATVSATATSYNDTTTSKHNDYRYRVQAVNGTGTGTSGQSNRVRTTPAPPTNVSAQKSGDNIIVSFTQTMTPDEGTSNQIQDNPGGTGWVTVGTTTNPSTYTHTNPDPAVTHQYRVRTVDNLNTTINGEWSSTSNVVQLLAPPLAPTPLTPMGTINRDEPIVFRWQHHPVDTTDQTEFELEWWLSYQPNNPVTLTGGSEQEVSQSPLGSTNSFSWRVRTKGEYAGANSWSPWSPTQTFYLASQPEVTISEPGNVLEQSQVEVIWTYQNEDAAGQTQWEAELLGENEELLEQASGSGSTDSHEFQTILDDATEYTVRVRVRAGSGLWSDWDTSEFITDFPLPAAVEVLPVKNDEDASVTLTFQEDEWAQYSWEGDPNDSPSVRVTDSGEIVNVFPNPSFHSEGDTVTIWNNFSANPRSLEGPMTPNDSPNVSASWLFGDIPEGYGPKTRVVCENSNHVPAMGIRDSGLPPPPPTELGGVVQSTYLIEVWAKIPSETMQYVTEFTATYGQTSRTIPGPFPADEWFKLETQINIRSDFSKADLVLEFDTPGAQSDDFIEFTDLWVSNRIIPEGMFFDSTYENTDPDMWMTELPDGGAALVGYAAVEAVSLGLVALKSSQWSKEGSESLRLFNNSGSGGYVLVSGGASGNASVVRYLDSPLTDSPAGPFSGGIVAGLYDGGTDLPDVIPPNEAGESVVRVSRKSEEDWLYIVLNGSTTLGESVWFDLLTITEEPYDGPPFSGNSITTIATEWIDVQRQDSESGEWVTLATDLDPETSVIDHIPRITDDVRYRAISRTGLPSARIGPEASIDMTYDCDRIFVNGGQDFSMVGTALGNALSRTPKVESAAHQWSGWDFPQAVFGRGEEYGLSFTAPLIDTSRGMTSTREDGWVELLRTRRVICFRDTFERKFFGILGTSFSQNGVVDNLSLNVTRTHYIEGVEPVIDPEDIDDEDEDEGGGGDD